MLGNLLELLLKWWPLYLWLFFLAYLSFSFSDTHNCCKFASGTRAYDLIYAVPCNACRQFLSKYLVSEQTLPLAPIHRACLYTKFHEKLQAHYSQGWNLGLNIYLSIYLPHSSSPFSYSKFLEKSASFIHPPPHQQKQKGWTINGMRGSYGA